MAAAIARSAAQRHETRCVGRAHAAVLACQARSLQRGALCIAARSKGNHMHATAHVPRNLSTDATHTTTTCDRQARTLPAARRALVGAQPREQQRRQPSPPAS